MGARSCGWESVGVVAIVALLTGGCEAGSGGLGGPVGTGGATLGGADAQATGPTDAGSHDEGCSQIVCSGGSSCVLWDGAPVCLCPSGLAVGAHGCGAAAGQDAGGSEYDAGGQGGSEDDAGSQGGGGHPALSCTGVDCGPHAFCEMDQGYARCACEADWRWTPAGCASEDPRTPGDPCDGVDCGTKARCVSPDGKPRCEPTDAVAVACARVLEDRAALWEGSWDGSTATCTPGTMSQDWQERTLRSVNLYRWLAGVPALTLDASAYVGEQACALMMQANGALSHSPPQSWACWSQEGAGAAGQSSIAGTSAVAGVDLYVADPGNPDTLGHRRWVLSPWISATAFGSTSGYSCMRTYGYGGAGPAFVAWPPPGVYPMELHNASWASVDTTGWSIQSDSLALGGATVTITEDGLPRPVTTKALLPNYGSGSALAILPQGWGIKAGSTYSVTVAGAGQPVGWSFVAVTCGAL